MPFPIKIVFGLAWLSSVAVVFQLWIDYDHDPGRAGDTLPLWPIDSRLKLDERYGTLVVFLHPFCPCSQKGMRKIERIIADRTNRPTCYFLFSDLNDNTVVETDSDNWRRARSLSREGTLTDFDAVEATRFGAKTSGFLAFYDAAGRLRFRGGITSERGGEQSNAFERLLSEAIAGSDFPLVSTPVYGCPLVERKSP
ncbi:MAG: hypothetical protein K8U03_25895 [Planctomycetia bacterium]|nr:hypothetical protein [Planctomycetia bacterium]